MRTAYIIGVPGSGKSTIVRQAWAALGGFTPFAYEQPVPHMRWFSDVWEIGRWRPSFSGTDALALNINPKAIQWVQSLDASGMGPRCLIAEGDRLANTKFLDACPSLTVFHVATPLDVARERAESRARLLNVPTQNESWWKGRATKTANLAARYNPTVIDSPDPLVRWINGDP